MRNIAAGAAFGSGEGFIFFLSACCLSIAPSLYLPQLSVHLFTCSFSFFKFIIQKFLWHLFLSRPVMVSLKRTIPKFGR